jgi:uncharacterized protein YbjT (DUF2867 family)
VTSSPSFEDDPVLEFLHDVDHQAQHRGQGREAGQYVALSIAGVEGLPDSGYMRTKVAQASGPPYSIVRATQFAEFTDAIIGSMTDGNTVRVPEAQPIAADDVGGSGFGSPSVSRPTASRRSADPEGALLEQRSLVITD